MGSLFVHARGITWCKCPTLLHVIGVRGKPRRLYNDKVALFCGSSCSGRASANGSYAASAQGEREAQDEISAFERLMKHARLTHIAQELWQQVCRPGDVVVDATCGNGHDTLCLANAVGKKGTLYGFDVQESAIASTRQQLYRFIPTAEHPKVYLLQQSHATMKEVVGSNLAKLIVFNLGFLPGSDKTVITQQSSTVEAVKAACEVLQYGGLLSVLSYTGHEGGMEEYQAVQQLISKLPPSEWVTSQVQLLNRPTAPILLLAWKQHRE